VRYRTARALPRTLFHVLFVGCLRVVVVRSCVRATHLVRMLSRAVPRVVARRSCVLRAIRARD
jgi:hypothetical protein